MAPLQLLGMLQSDARILDFFMEDIAPYSDEQIGAAARDVHERTRETADPPFRARAGDRRRRRQRGRSARRQSGARQVHRQRAGFGQSLRRASCGIAAGARRRFRCRSSIRGRISPCSRRRKSKWSSGLPRYSHRHRSRHHQLRARVYRDFGRGAVGASSPTFRSWSTRTKSRGTAAAFVSLYARRARFPGGLDRAAVGFRQPRFVAGKLAQRRGAEVSSRLVSSAKSWLSYSSVDRTAAMLPWKAAEGVARISPVDASAEYLKHLRSAWDHEHPDAPFAEQEVLVTVPASFDADRARTDRESRRGRRIPQRHHARRAAGRVLRLDRAASATGASACSKAI